jgi:ribosome recycling factor
MANLAIRKIKADLRDMEKSGEISKEIRWTVGKKVQKLYDKGLKDYEKLFEKTIKFITDEKKEGK